MVSFLVAPDEAIKADEANKVCSRLARSMWLMQKEKCMVLIDR